MEGDILIRVLVIEDHPRVRAGLDRLLSSANDIEVVGLAAGGAEGIVLAAARTPDVILIDLSMPLLDGIETTRRIVRSIDGARVLLLTASSDGDRILEALDAGAVGCLFKDAEPEQLFAEIRAAGLD